MGKLTPKREAWLKEYLKCWNATEAARRVSFAHPNTQGPRLLLDVGIKALIDEYIMNADEAAANITDIARGDMADLMSITSSGFTLELMVKDPITGEMKVNPNTKLIKKIKQKVTTYLAKKEDEEDREVIETEIELYSRHEANRDILKYRGKMIDRTETLNVDVATLTNEQIDELLAGKSLPHVIKRR